MNTNIKDMNIIATSGRSLDALGKIGLFCGVRALIALGVVRDGVGFDRMWM